MACEQLWMWCSLVAVFVTSGHEIVPRTNLGLDSRGRIWVDDDVSSGSVLPSLKAGGVTADKRGHSGEAEKLPIVSEPAHSKLQKSSCLCSKQKRNGSFFGWNIHFYVNHDCFLQAKLKPSNTTDTASEVCRFAWHFRFKEYIKGSDKWRRVEPWKAYAWTFKVLLWSADSHTWSLLKVVKNIARCETQRDHVATWPFFWFVDHMTVTWLCRWWWTGRRGWCAGTCTWRTTCPTRRYVINSQVINSSSE